jgi:hypothetical protein
MSGTERIWKLKEEFCQKLFSLKRASASKIKHLGELALKAPEVDTFVFACPVSLK